jgi:hypothetical protein
MIITSFYKTVDIEHDGSCVTNLYYINSITHKWEYVGMNSFNKNWEKEISSFTEVGLEEVEGNTVRYYIDQFDTINEKLEEEQAELTEEDGHY